MSQYSNLASLEGLLVDDTIIYTENTIIDIPSNYKVKIELYGGGGGTYYSAPRGKGGYTYATIDASLLNEKISVLFSGTETNHPYKRPASSTRGGSPCVSYGSFNDYASCLYYRFLVAGEAGLYCSDAYELDGSTKVGVGGGLTGGKSEHNPNSGGGMNGGPGSFGYGEYFIPSEYGGGPGTVDSGGGDGWYGGGTDAYYTNNANFKLAASYHGTGGSGFVIGKITTNYPKGYLGDDEELFNKVLSAVSDADTVQGEGAINNTRDSDNVRVVFTILNTEAEVEPEPDPEPEPEPDPDIPTKELKFKSFSFKYYKNGKFINCRGYYYSNDNFNHINFKYYTEES